MAKPRDYLMTFTGPGSREVLATGRFLRVLEASVSYVWVSLDNGSELKRYPGQAINDSDGFVRFAVRSEVAQAVRISVADERQDDNSAAVIANVNASLEPATAYDDLAAVTVPAGNKVKIADANSSRKELRVAIASDQPGGLWIGSSGIAADTGGWLEPGMVDYIASEAETWAFNPGAADVVVSVLDLERP